MHSLPVYVLYVARGLCVSIDPGVATVSGVAVSAIVASVVLCVVVAIVVKLRAPRKPRVGGLRSVCM